MAKVKYYAKENTKLGTHSFYAVPVPNGTLTFDEVCEEACRNTSVEPSFMKAAVAEYMKAVKSNVLKGFRVPLGDQFLTIYPNLNASVKDAKDKDGNLRIVFHAHNTTTKVHPRHMYIGTAWFKEEDGKVPELVISQEFITPVIGE